MGTHIHELTVPVFIQKMQRTDDMRKFEENKSPESESVRSKSENGSIHDFAEDAYLQKVDSENSKDSKSENNPNFHGQATLEKKSKPPNKKVDKKRCKKVDGLRKEKEALKSECDGVKSSIRQKDELKINLKDVSLDNKFSLDYKIQTEYSKSLTKVNQYELDVKRLEDRVIQADETLREFQLINATVVKNLQDELKRLSVEMTSNVNEKEQLASQAQNLQEELDKCRQELSLTKDPYKKELSALELESLRQQILKENKRVSSSQKPEDFDKKMEEKNTEIERLCAELELERRKKDELKIHLKDVSLDYEVEVKRLGEKIVNQAMELSQSLDTVSKYKTHIKRSDEELEKLGRDYKDDIEYLKKDKIEQEERVVKNLQEELDKCRQELSLTKNTYKQEAHELCDKIDRQAEQIKELSLNLEISKKHGESKEGTTQEWIIERELLVTEFALLKKETEKLQKESTSWKSLISEKNFIIRVLQSELKTIRGDYNELKQRLLGIVSEKVNLQKEEIKVASEGSSKHDESRSILGSAKSNEGNDEEKLSKLLSEVLSLGKRNNHLESELKGMQEKYSEVSLRFAEVEGERQELVMALRKLRNGKK